MIFFLVRIIAFIGVLYLAYSFYKSLRKPVEKGGSKTTACPTPKTFIDYTEGRIKGRKKEDIAEHIAHCKNCQDALKGVFDMTESEGSKK